MGTIRKYLSGMFLLFAFLSAVTLLFSFYSANCYAYQILRESLKNQSFEAGASE